MTTKDQTLVRATASGTFWNYVTVYSGKILVLVSTVVLARLLTTNDFGVAGYAILVITFLDMLNDLGIGQALIYHRDEDAANTAFWVGLVVSLCLYGFTWLIAPFAAKFFNNPNVTSITRTLGLTFPLLSLRNVHAALLRKNLSFKRKFVPDLIQTIVKGIVSIVLALLGFSYWSLIIGQLSGTAASIVFYWIAYPWRPTLSISKHIAKTLLAFGLNIVALNSLARLIFNIDYLLIGRYLGDTALGIYTVAFRIPELLVLQFCYVIGQVVFPVYAKMRDQEGAMTEGFLATTRYVALVTVPCGIGMALVSEPFVLTIFGEKWRAAIPVMRVLAIYAMILSLTFNSGDIYKAEGRPSILTKLAIVRLCFLFPALWWAAVIARSIVFVAIGQAAVAMIATLLDFVVASRLLRTSFSQIMDALRPSLIGGAVMGVVVFAVLTASHTAPESVQLLVGIIAGVTSYAIALWWLQREAMQQAHRTLRAAFSRQ